MTTRPRKTVVGIAVLLCLFGAYESIDATFAVFRPVADAQLGDLFTYRPWSLTHFLPGALFMILAPLQLWGSFRNRHRTLHRRSGRVVVACALLLGVSGLAFPFTMPQRPLAEQVFMTAFGAVFLMLVAKAYLAARRRDFSSHRAWMIRLFATGLTITTQRLMLPVFFAVGGVSSVEEFWGHFVNAAWLAWAIQVAVAEWWLRSRPAVTPAVAPVGDAEAV